MEDAAPRSSDVLLQNAPTSSRDPHTEANYKPPQRRTGGVKELDRALSFARDRTL
jgi:hypothetical protein